MPNVPSMGNSTLTVATLGSLKLTPGSYITTPHAPGGAIRSPFSQRSMSRGEAYMTSTISPFSNVGICGHLDMPDFLEEVGAGTKVKLGVVVPMTYPVGGLRN